uniref:Uncharacterized protein n=1 Tax=Romanomermis culicivorax TaxID=13658 RepID=A0A915JPR8_ROMCU
MASCLIKGGDIWQRCQRSAAIMGGIFAKAMSSDCQASDESCWTSSPRSTLIGQEAGEKRKMTSMEKFGRLPEKGEN